VVSVLPLGWEVKPEVPCHKILRHVKELLKFHGDVQTKLSFPSPISYCSRGVSGDGQSGLVVRLGVCPSRSHLLRSSHRYHQRIVQQTQGRSAETAVSPHHNNQSTLYNLSLALNGFESYSYTKGRTQIDNVSEQGAKRPFALWREEEKGTGQNCTNISSISRTHRPLLSLC
jgi:hypothetical protein